MAIIGGIIVFLLCSVICCVSIIGWMIRNYRDSKWRQRNLGQNLQRKFKSAGTLRGKTLNEITAIVGRQSSFAKVPNTDQYLYVWQKGAYSITLKFEKGVCLGVIRESMNA